jgi:hypothetical protein
MAFTTTNAYARYKSQTDALLDFAVLISYSMPALRNAIQAAGSGPSASLPKPDFFHQSNRSSPTDLLNTEGHYEQNLASYVLLAHFSFFESLVDNLIKEMVEIHGGEAKFAARIQNRTRRFLANQSAQTLKAKRKLQDKENPRWRDSYRKHSRDLDEKGFRFPGELLAAYGVRTLLSNLRKKNLKAVHIPEVLVHAFQVDLSEREIEKYHEIRDIRNDIAHGNPVVLTIKQVVAWNAALRDIALKASSHISEHFFVIEKYVPGNPFSA